MVYLVRLYTVNEGVKAAVFIGETDTDAKSPFVIVRNRLIKTAPPAYKNVVVTLLINETGNPLDEIIEK